MCRLQGIRAALALVLVTVPATAGPKNPRRTEPPLPPGARARLGLSGPRHEGTVRAVALSPDSKLVASTGQDGTLRLWETATGRELLCRDGLGKAPGSLTFSPDSKVLIAAGGLDGTLWAWETATGQEVYRGTGISHAAFSPDGKSLAAASDGEVRLWEASTGKELRRLRGLRGPALALTFTDGKTIWAVDETGTAHAWDASTGKQTRRLAVRPHRSAEPHAAAIAPNARLALTVKGDNTTVYLWDLNAARPLRQFQGHQGIAVSALAFSTDGKSLVSAGDDAAVCLWDVQTGKNSLKLSPHQQGVVGVALAGDGKVVASGSEDCRVRLWDAATGRPLWPGEADGVASLAFSPDGKTLVAGSTSGLVRAWDARTWKEQRRLAAHAVAVDAVAFSPDGRTLATGGRDRRVILWDAGAGRERARLTGPSPRVNCLAFTVDGQTLAAGGGVDGQGEPILLWQTATGNQLGELRGHNSGTLALVFLPDGRLASSGGDRTVSLHLPLGNEGAVALEGHVAAEARLVLTADARSLVSADMSGTVCIWELLTRKIRFRVADPDDTHYAIAVSPDGRLAAVGGWGKTVTVFDLATGTTVARFRGHQDAIHALVFAPDGRTIASGGPDGTVFVWDVALPPARPVAIDAKQMEALWADLGGEDAGKAYRAVWRLALSGEVSVPFLRDRLAAPNGRLVARKIADLDHNRFKVRQAAQAQLEQWGEEVLPALERALASKPTLEVRRRLESILARLGEHTPTGPQRAQVRAIEVFGKLGDGQALQVLTALAKDKQGTRLGQEARTTLDRLARQGTGK